VLALAVSVTALPAVKSAAKEIYGIDNAAYTWTDTTRYMGIFHGVQPKEKALKCADCHGANSRMDWKALGYKGNPMTVKPPPRGVTDKPATK
jgi:hypothetical protein